MFPLSCGYLCVLCKSVTSIVLWVVCLLHDVRLMYVFFFCFCKCYLHLQVILSGNLQPEPATAEISTADSPNTKQITQKNPWISLKVFLYICLEAEIRGRNDNYIKGLYILLCEGCTDVFAEHLYCRFTH